MEINEHMGNFRLRDVVLDNNSLDHLRRDDLWNSQPAVRTVEFTTCAQDGTRMHGLATRGFDWDRLHDPSAFLFHVHADRFQSSYYVECKWLHYINRHQIIFSRIEEITAVGDYAMQMLRYAIDMLVSCKTIHLTQVTCDILQRLKVEHTQWFDRVKALSFRQSPLIAYPCNHTIVFTSLETLHVWDTDIQDGFLSRLTAPLHKLVVMFDTDDDCEVDLSDLHRFCETLCVLELSDTTEVGVINTVHNIPTTLKLQTLEVSCEIRLDGPLPPVKHILLHKTYAWRLEGQPVA